MPSTRRFAKTVLSVISDNKVLGLRAGTDDHRFIGVWSVVVEGRVFVRSWNDKPDGWHRAFLEEPSGAIQIPGREIRVRARRPRGERLMEAIDLAYAAKYHTPAALRYVRGFRGARRRRTTTELVPV